MWINTWKSDCDIDDCYKINFNFLSLRLCIALYELFTQSKRLHPLLIPSFTFLRMARSRRKTIKVVSGPVKEGIKMIFGLDNQCLEDRAHLLIWSFSSCTQEISFSYLGVCTSFEWPKCLGFDNKLTLVLLSFCDW